MIFPTYEQLMQFNSYSMINHAYIGYTYFKSILPNFFIQIQCINSISRTECNEISFALCTKAGIPVWSETYRNTQEGYFAGVTHLMNTMMLITHSFTDIVNNNLDKVKTYEDICNS